MQGVVYPSPGHLWRVSWYVPTVLYASCADSTTSTLRRCGGGPRGGAGRFDAAAAAPFWKRPLLHAEAHSALVGKDSFPTSCIAYEHMHVVKGRCL